MRGIVRSALGRVPVGNRTRSASVAVALSAVPPCVGWTRETFRGFPVMLPYLSAIRIDGGSASATHSGWLLQASANVQRRTAGAVVQGSLMVRGWRSMCSLRPWRIRSGGEQWRGKMCLTDFWYGEGPSPGLVFPPLAGTGASTSILRLRRLGIRGCAITTYLRQRFNLMSVNL